MATGQTRKKSLTKKTAEVAIKNRRQPNAGSRRANIESKNIVNASVRNDVVYWLGYDAKQASKIQTDMDVVQLGREGITRLAVESLASHLGVSKKTFAEEVLAISVKTLERKDKKERFDRRVSSQAVEIAKVAQHAYTVFESEERLKRWLHAPLAVIGNNRPVDMLDTMSGINLVHQLLTRIEEGVYS